LNNHMDQNIKILNSNHRIDFGWVLILKTTI